MRPRTMFTLVNLITLLMAKQAPPSFGRAVAIFCCVVAAILLIVLALRDLLDPPL